MNSYYRVFAFVVMLLPLTALSADGIGISINYSYGILVPIVAKFAFRKNFDAYLYILFLFFSGVIGALINSLVMGVGSDMIARQFLSLVIAMLPVTFLFFDLSKYYDGFKDAVLVCSISYSIFAIYNFLVQSSLNGVNPFMMKEVLSDYIPDWPQRYVLVLFAGFYFTFDRNRYRSNIIIFVRSIILVCIVITFLRAAYLSLIIGFIFFHLSKFSSNRKIVDFGLEADLKSKKSLSSYFIFLLLMGIFLFDSSNLDAVISIMENLTDSFFNFLGGHRGENPSDETRIDIFGVILNTLVVSPLTGFGGAGIYVFSSEYGSSHNQFFDFLIRFGIIGLLLFLYFNIRILKYFWFKEPCVVALIASYFVFGFAHETTKYSYGGAIFFFLLSLTYTKNLKER